MAIAIYARQSVERENSISCETQIEYCKSCLKPDERKEKILEFIDEGFTGANTNRVDFQKMMRQIERGKNLENLCLQVRPYQQVSIRLYGYP